ncbi:MAG: hypothetical protein Q9159_002968 [Coniocarpon cinnabarinum]
MAGGSGFPVANLNAAPPTPLPPISPPAPALSTGWPVRRPSSLYFCPAHKTSRKDSYGGFHLSFSFSSAMLAFQKAPAPWQDRTLHGMEHDPPPAKRRRLTREQSQSITSVGTLLPYGWVSEHVVAADSAGETSGPAYPTLLANSYWSQPQEEWSSYRAEMPTASDAHSSQFGLTSSVFGGERYGAYDAQDIDWQDLGNGESSLSSFPECLPRQPTTAVNHHHSRVPPSANPSSWDIMTSGPNGPQYEYLDSFAKQSHVSPDGYAPYVEAPVLRSNLPMAGRASMAPPPQPQVNPQKARETLHDFEEHLESALENVQVSLLPAAAEELMIASRLLMSNARDLRLYNDKVDGQEPGPNWRSKRREIWHLLNIAWLGLLTKQMDLSQHERNGYPPQHPQARIARTNLSVIGFEMRSLVDKIKDLGLVDYEQGFNEWRITEVFEVCVDLANELEGPLPGWSEGTATTSAAGQFS